MVEVLFSEIHILIQFSILSWGMWADATMSPDIWLEVIPLIVQKWWFSSLLKYIVSLERLSLVIKITYEGDSLPPQCLCWELCTFFLFNKSYSLATMSVCMFVDSTLPLCGQELRFPSQQQPWNMDWAGMPPSKGPVCCSAADGWGRLVPSSLPGNAEPHASSAGWGEPDNVLGIRK